MFSPYKDMATCPTPNDYLWVLSVYVCVHLKFDPHSPSRPFLPPPLSTSNYNTGPLNEVEMYAVDVLDKAVEWCKGCVVGLGGTG